MQYIFSFRLDYNNHSENQKNMYTIQFIEGEQKKKYTDVFKSGGNIFG